MHDIGTRTAWLVAALMTIFALDALAQSPGGSRGRPDGPRPQPGIARGEMPGGAADLANLLEFRLETMQDDLKLTPNQHRLFDAYADKVRALGDDILRDRARPQPATPPPAPQQIEHLLDIARNRMTALEDIAASAKNLYASLTPEQKLLADSRVATLVPLLAGTAVTPMARDQRRAGPPRGGPQERDAPPPR